jgi:L-ascorbate metabolism protein UlaG (beta-lactamase superfamily)
MNTQKVFLKQNVQVEPLINSWYGWIPMLAPATAALNLTGRYMPIMESFISSPFMHVAAIKDPSMRGGPFIDMPLDDVEKVKELLEQTIADNQLQIEFAKAIKELNSLLKEKAKGFSLEPLYKQIPEVLRGYVELCYDLNNNPTFRFIEPLLYRSAFYTETNQSVALSLINKDGERPFILSTPVLKGSNKLHLSIAFKNTALDELFKMKKVAQPYGHICRLLRVQDEDEPLFRQFFTTEKPREYSQYDDDYVRIRYFGHACILIEARGITILLDPVLSYTYESAVSRFTYEDIPDWIDYVLITHSHNDHILLETIIQLRHKIGHVIVGRNIDGALQDPSLMLSLKNLGVKSVMELRELDEVTFGSGSIMGIPFLGEHHDIHIHSKLGYLIKINNYSILAVADSCNIDPILYDHVHSITGDIDILFLGMECDGAPASWVYGPLLHEELSREQDRSRRGRGCNYEEGMEIINRFNFKEVYVYAMGQEPWLRHILDLEFSEKSNPIIQSNQLISRCGVLGIVAERLYGEKELIKHK